MYYNLDNLTKLEAREYVLTKLNRDKCSNNIFDKTALEAIANASNGGP